MKNTYQTFVNELLEHGDKFRAYKAAYPNASGESLRVATNRLLQRPEIQELLSDAGKAARAKALVSFEENVSAELQDQFTSIQEKRRILHLMITGQWKTKRYIKLKDRIEEVEEDISPHALLRAIELDAKLEEWQRRLAAEQEEARKLEERRQPTIVQPSADPFPKYGTADDMCAWHKRHDGEGTCRVTDNNVMVYESADGKVIARHQVREQPPKLQPHTVGDEAQPDKETMDDAEKDWLIYKQHGGLRSNLGADTARLKDNFLSLSPASRKALLRPLLSSTG